MSRVIYIGRTLGKTHLQSLIKALEERNETIVIVPESGVIDLKEALKKRVPKQANLFPNPKPSYYDR